MNNRNINSIDCPSASARVLRSFRPFYGHVASLQFSPDAGLLAIGTANGSIEIIDLASSKVLKRIKIHELKITDLQFSSDSSILYAVGDHGCIGVIDMKSFNVVKPLLPRNRFNESQTTKINFAALDEKNLRLYYGGENGLLYYLDLNDLKSHEYSPKGSDAKTLSHFFITSGRISPFNDLLGVAIGFYVLVIDLAKHKIIKHIGPTIDFINDFVFLPGNGNVMACWVENGTISFYDVVREKELTTIISGDDSWSHLDISKDGLLLASGNDRCNVNIWNVHTKNKVAVLNSHMSTVRKVLFHPVTGNLFTGGEDGVVNEWEIKF